MSDAILKVEGLVGGYGAMTEMNAFAGRQYPERITGLMHVDEAMAGKPQQLAEVMQKVTIGVDVLRTLKHLEIAEHVTDHEGEHHGAGHRHDNLLAVRRLPKRYR